MPTWIVPVYHSRRDNGRRRTYVGLVRQAFTRSLNQIRSTLDDIGVFPYLAPRGESRGEKLLTTSTGRWKIKECALIVLFKFFLRDARTHMSTTLLELMWDQIKQILMASWLLPHANRWVCYLDRCLPDCFSGGWLFRGFFRIHLDPRRAVTASLPQRNIGITSRYSQHVPCRGPTDAPHGFI